MAPTQPRLRELFAYRTDGALVKRAARRGNTVGAEAGSINSMGYKNVMVDGQRLLAHRLVFLYHNGWLPDQVDHKNGIKSDNRIENLRPANATLNGLNRSINTKNTTGVKNVHFEKSRGRYAVRLAVDGKQKRVGSFESLQDAGAAACAARLRHHGEFANHGSFVVS